MKMRTIEVNGKTIKTNYAKGHGYPMGSGNDKKNYRMVLPNWVLNEGDTYKHKESAEEMFSRLVEAGYTTIRFEEVSTMVRGLHDIIAYVKKDVAKESAVEIFNKLVEREEKEEPEEEQNTEKKQEGETTMEERVNRAKEMIENSIKWAEEDLANERKQVLRIAENGSADEIIAWANHMKDTEARIHAYREQLKVVEFIGA